MNDAVSNLSADHLPRRPMAERIRQLRRGEFVGRSDQRRIFGAALREEHDAPRVLLVHGPGGIGKSALLRQFADDAEHAAHSITWIDGQNVAASSVAFEREAEPVRTALRPVLLVDGFEHCQVLEGWLREEFLLTVPENTVIVLAGRNRPETQWTLEPGLRTLVRLMPMDPLSAEDAAVLLENWQVPEHLREALNNFAAGSPLALCLAAQTTTDGDSLDDATWRPSPDVIKVLLTQLIDQVTSPSHEYALRVCGHVRHTTVDLLRTGLDESEAVAAFEWLSGLPYVERGAHGLLPHELVREMLDADFAWRDPAAYSELHTRLWLQLGKRVYSLTGEAIAASVSELLYLTRYTNEARTEVSEAHTSKGVFEREYTDDLREDVLRLARDDQDDEFARLVVYWLDRRPKSFHVYCDAVDRKPVAFLAWLRLEGATAEELATDPFVAAMVESVQRAGGLHPGQYAGFARFGIPAPEVGSYISTGASEQAVRISTQLFRDPEGCVANFLCFPSPAVFESNLAAYEYLPACTMPGPKGKDWTLFIRDYRKVPIGQELERSVPALWSANGTHGSHYLPRRPASTPLSRKKHDDAVKQLLRDWFDDDAVAVNPLARVHGNGIILRLAVSAAIKALDEDPRRVKHQRVLRATFLERVTSQEAAAARVGIPFGTYRRYLRAGLAGVCEQLWTDQQPLMASPGAEDDLLVVNTVPATGE